MFLVNRAQAYKWSGDKQTTAEILRQQDWSATSDSFKLAEAVLNERYEEAARLMKTIGPSGEPHKVDYRDWPLFREFRKTPEFRKAYEDVFGQPAFEAEIEEELGGISDIDEENNELPGSAGRVN